MMRAMSSRSAHGVLAMFIAVAGFSCMDALLKVFSAHYPPMQVTALRAIASLPFLLLPLWWQGRLSEIKPRRIGLHLARGVLGVIMLGTFVVALSQGAIASVYSIYMAAPLLIAALAAFWLGEQVDAGRWLAIAVGLLGVLLILRPEAGGLPLVAGLAAALSAACYALAAITARILTRTDSSASIVFSFLFIMGLLATALAWPDWAPIRAQDYALIAAVGMFGAIGQHYITEAFRHAPAAVVAPIEYTALLWAIAIDWAFWQVLPGIGMLQGAALVVLAGLYVAWRERQATDSPAGT
jgi:drug/metabolite transporter (DMT)-like permease